MTFSFAADIVSGKYPLRSRNASQAKSKEFIILFPNQNHEIVGGEIIKVSSKTG